MSSAFRSILGMIHYPETPLRKVLPHRRGQRKQDRRSFSFLADFPFPPSSAASPSKRVSRKNHDRRGYGGGLVRPYDPLVDGTSPRPLDAGLGLRLSNGRSSQEALKQWTRRRTRPPCPFRGGALNGASPTRSSLQNNRVQATPPLRAFPAFLRCSFEGDSGSEGSFHLFFLARESFVSAERCHHLASEQV